MRTATMIVLASTIAACSQPPAPEPAPPPEPLESLVDGLASGAVDVVDLTQPLNAGTPVIQLPPPLANTPGFTPHVTLQLRRQRAWLVLELDGGG